MLRQRVVQRETGIPAACRRDLLAARRVENAKSAAMKAGLDAADARLMGSRVQDIGLIEQEASSLRTRRRLL